MKDNEKFLTAAQAGKEVGVSKRAIYAWLHAGKITAVERTRGHIIIPRSSLYRLTNTRTIPGTDGQKWAGINKASAYAKIHKNTLFKWLRSGEIEYAHTAGGSPLIRLNSLLRYRRQRMGN